MKLKLDKYRGQCNTVLSIVANLDLRQKMAAIEFSFPRTYPAHEAQKTVASVKMTVFDLYKEDVAPNKDGEYMKHKLEVLVTKMDYRHPHLVG